MLSIFNKLQGKKELWKEFWFQLLLLLLLRLCHGFAFIFSSTGQKIRFSFSLTRVI